MSDLDFSDISTEKKGSMVPGRLKITDTQIHFKPKAGKVFSIDDTEIELINWLRYGNQWGIRIFTTGGNLIRYSGFKEADKEKLSKAFSNRFGKTMSDMEVCVKGWNWGTAKFKGSVLSFDVANSHGFDVPLSYVSQCTTGKNEVTLEFHQNDEARESSLMEMRFHMPSSDNAGDTEPGEVFKEYVLDKADVIGAVGDAIAIFREIPCLTPRGRYDIKIYQSFFQLHGKTFDYKIPMSTVLRLFLLPHVDLRQIFFVVSLDPPIKQGQTRYPYLVFTFFVEDECSISLPFSEEELQTKYGGKLEKELSGPTFQVVSRMMKVLVDRKLTGPGKFSATSGHPSVSCSYKAAAGYLYPLERGFMFVHKPPIHIRMEEVSAANFSRSGGGTKSFDFELELKSGVVHTFVGIVKDEYQKLFAYVNTKGIRVKNTDKIDFEGRKYDGKGEPDAYLARVKAEAEERSDDDGRGGGSESSEDEDYNPDAAKVSDVSEEDSEGASSSSGGGDDGSDDDAGSGSGSEKGKKKKKKDVKAAAKTKGKASKPPKEKPERKKRETKTNKPKKAAASPKKGKSGKKSESPNSSGGVYQSKEFISDADSSSSDAGSG